MVTDAHPLSAADLGTDLERLRQHHPTVQCLTNIVASRWTANALHALGAAPAMIDNAHEARAFAALADGVLINLGTPQEDTAEAMSEAAAGAVKAGTPWVLDPIGAGSLTWRTRIAYNLVAEHPPTVIRGNASEVLGLSGGAGGFGAESQHTADEAVEAAGWLARDHDLVVAVSGGVDHLTDGQRTVKVHNDCPGLTLITGAGCVLGAFMSAFLAVVDDPLRAATAATAVLTVAGEQAEASSRGPGSLAVNVLDELSALSPETLSQRVQLS